MANSTNRWRSHGKILTSCTGTSLDSEKTCIFDGISLVEKYGSVSVIVAELDVGF